MRSQISHYINISKSLLRVPTYLLLCLYLLVGFLSGLYFRNGELELFSAFLQIVGCALLIALWYMNGTALNDYADYEIDQINLKGDKDRPLIVGLAHRNELTALASAYAISALGIAYLISFEHFILLAGLLLLNYAYSIKPLQISRRGGLAPLLLPLGYVLLPYLLGYGLVSQAVTKSGWFLLASLYLQFMGRIILKDHRDVKGDAAHGKRTFLLRHGNNTVCIVSGVSIAASALVITTIFDLGIFLYPIVVLTTYSLTMLYRLSKTSKWTEQKPVLAAFGRSMTGVTVVIIIVLTSLLWHFSRNENIVLAFGLTIVYLASAQQAFVYNTHRLATKKSSK